MATLEHEKILTPAEFAAAWGICTMTATRWANRGYVQVRHTLGGHRRFLESETPAGREQAAGITEPTP